MCTGVKLIYMFAIIVVSMSKTNDKEKTKTIFSKIKPTIFNNVNVLSPDYIPDKLIARDEEIEEVSNAFSPYFIGGNPRNLILQGKSGTGKTVVVRYVVSQLLKEVDMRTTEAATESREHGNLPKVLFIEINCEEKNTIIRIIYDIITKIDVEVQIPEVGMATSWYFDKLWEVINKNNVSVIVSLDEIDKIDANTILYNLSRARSRKIISFNLFIMIIGITNNTRYLTEGSIESRVTSSLNPLSIVFSPYDADQLGMILHERAESAFMPGVLDEMVIPICAARGAQEHGDARKALSLLEAAGHITVQRGENLVTEKHVDEALRYNDRNSMLMIIKDQPMQSKIVLLSIIYQWQLRDSNVKYLTTGEIYKQYCGFAGEIDQNVLSVQRVSELLSELDYLNVISAPVDNKGRRGRTKKVTISLPIKEVIESVSNENDRLPYLVEKLWGKPIENNPNPSLYVRADNGKGKQLRF